MTDPHPFIRLIEHQETARDKERDPVGWWLRKLDFSRLKPMVNFSIARSLPYIRDEVEIHMSLFPCQRQDGAQTVRREFSLRANVAHRDLTFAEAVIKREIRQFLGEGLWSLVGEHSDAHVHNRGYKTSHPEDTRPGPVDPFWGERTGPESVEPEPLFADYLKRKGGVDAR